MANETTELTLADIRMGDTVRLRNGETIVVDGKTTSYTDKDGEHEGPFVTEAKTFDHYFLADVAEITEKNERLCRFCGDGVTSTNPETDFCRNCHYTGRAEEERLATLLTKLAEPENVDTVAVWHTGGGCFNLAVMLRDGRLATPSVARYEEGEGRWWPEPGFPEEESDRWGIVVAASEEAWSEHDESKIVIPNLGMDEDALVAFVRLFATLPAGTLEVPEPGEVAPAGWVRANGHGPYATLAEALDAEREALGG